jgi:DNA-binding transcriptional LysR family regulator
MGRPQRALKDRMERLEDLQIFVHTADNASLSAAARELDLTPAVASAALKRLETALDTRLLVRSTRSLRLTPEGERYLGFARQALAALAAGKASMAQGKNLIGGNLSLSIPSDLGRHVLMPWLDEFQNRHAQVRLQIRISDRLVDMFRETVDVVIRYGKPADSTLVALPLEVGNQRVLCGAPAYFSRHGKPVVPDDLLAHNCLCFMLGDTMYNDWRFGTGDTAQTISVKGDRISDDAELVHRWAVEGRGLAYKSKLDVLQDLRAGRLVGVLTDYATEPYPLYMLCPHRMMLSPTVNTLKAFLGEKIARLLSSV